MFLRMTLGLGLASMIGAHAAHAGDADFTAKVFDLKDKKKLMFTYKQNTEVNGDRHIAHRPYFDLSGTLVAEETVETVKNGEQEKLVSYKLSQKQIGAEGLIELKGPKAVFSYSKDGSTKTAEESVGDDFVIGPTITPFLQRHWSAILKGEKIKARWGVPDRRETVGFEYFKDREETIDGKKAIVVKMKPSSFLIAALVNPLYFFMTADGSRLLEVHGRTQLKVKEDGSLKDFDGITSYDYSPAGNAK